MVKDPDLSIEVTVDGKDISNRIVRAKTDFFKVTFPKDNIFGVVGLPRLHGLFAFKPRRLLSV